MHDNLKWENCIQAITGKLRKDVVCRRPDSDFLEALVQQTMQQGCDSKQVGNWTSFQRNCSWTLKYLAQFTSQEGKLSGLGYREAPTDGPFLISGSLNPQSKFRYVRKRFAGSSFQNSIKATGFESCTCEKPVQMKSEPDSDNYTLLSSPCSTPNATLFGMYSAVVWRGCYRLLLNFVQFAFARGVFDTL